jgi:ParB-like chromosome segregation protein Spo0J
MASSSGRCKVARYSRHQHLPTHVSVDQDGLLTMENERNRAVVHQTAKHALVPVDSLLPADSPRLHGEDNEHVQRLAESEAELPPILVQQGKMRVIDGMHRLRAAILKGCRCVEVEFFDGDDVDAFIRAVEQNVTHGLPLTLADRKAAAARILRVRAALSDRAVASITGLSPKTVGAVRERLTEEIPRLDARQGRDGRLRPLNSSDRRLRAAEAIREHPDASLREIAAFAGISPETARSVQARLASGDDPAQAGPQRRGCAVRHPVDGADGAAGSSATAEASMSSPQDYRDYQPTAEITAAEIKSILQKLSKDPSLRHSETGRRLLEAVHAKAVDDTLRAALLQQSLPHSKHLLARLARCNARIWKEIEDELRRQVPPA